MPALLLRGDYIAGRFRTPGRAASLFEDQDPGDLDSPLGTCATDPGHVDEAVGAAAAAFPAWAERPASERFRALERYRDEVRDRGELLASLITRETGKPRHEALGEVRSMVFKVDVVLREAMPLVAEVQPEGVHGFCRFRPRGVVAILAPPILPAHIANTHLVPALATGNTVVLRPSPFTPKVGEALAEIAEAAGLPSGVFNMVHTDDRGARDLALHPDVALVVASGSRDYTRDLVVETADRAGKLTVVESPGKNAAIVLPDANLDRAIHEVYVGAFLTSGQRFMSTRRLILHRHVAEGFLEAFLPMVRQTPVGYGLDPGTFLGPLVSEEARNQAEAVARAARADGATVLVPQRVPETPRKGYYLTPSVHLVERFDPDSPYQAPPALAPDLAVYLVDTLEEGLALANATDFRFAAAVFTRNPKTFEAALASLRFGVVNWNRATVSVSARTPVVGRGYCGNDHPQGLFSVYYCTAPVATLTDEGYLAPGERLPNVPRWKSPMAERMPP